MKIKTKTIIFSILACLILSTPLQISAWSHHRRSNGVGIGFGMLAGTMIGAAAASRPRTVVVQQPTAPQDQLTTARYETQRLQREMSSLQSDVSTLKNNADGLKNEIKDRDKEIDQLKEKIHELEMINLRLEMGKK